MLFCAACEHEVHSMRLFEHHRKGERDRVVPWELFSLTLPWATFDRLLGCGTELAAWFGKVLATLVHVLKREPSRSGVYLPDPLAMLAALQPSAVTRATELYGVVETSGAHTRGAVVFDWAHATTNKPNCTLVQDMDYDAFVAFLERVFAERS